VKRSHLVAAVVATAIGLLLFGYRYLDQVSNGYATPWLEPFVNELSSVYGGLLLLPLLVRVARRYRLDRRGWQRALPVHLAVALLGSVVLTSWRWSVRSLLFPLLGLGAFHYGAMPVRYFMELPMDVLVYAIVVGFTYLHDQFQAARQREVRLAQLETELVRAQLDTLRAQLDPHFLFNALNAVSSVMYDDPARADAVLVRLSDLLRRTLRESGEAETTLEDELEIVELYLDVMRARFTDRLDARVDASAEALVATVPSLLLQPLVENAVRHGAPVAGDVVRVHVCARVEHRSAGPMLVLEVSDAGPGIAGDWRAQRSGGIGLSHTAARLDRLYGARHRMDLHNAAGGGLRARIELPWETAPVAPAAQEPSWSA
jgi:signal transduction histidine kinase